MEAGFCLNNMSKYVYGLLIPRTKRSPSVRPIQKKWFSLNILLESLNTNKFLARMEFILDKLNITFCRLNVMLEHIFKPSL